MSGFCSFGGFRLIRETPQSGRFWFAGQPPYDRGNALIAGLDKARYRGSEGTLLSFALCLKNRIVPHRRIGFMRSVLSLPASLAAIHLPLYCMVRKTLYGLLALLLSVIYLTGSLELDEEEFKAHYQQEQVSALCVTAPAYHVPAATVVALLPERSFCFRRILHSVTQLGFAAAWLLREPAPPGRLFLRFRVLRL